MSKQTIVSESTPEPTRSSGGRKPVAVIYTHALLAGSMTFIKSQAESLRGYDAVYAGAHKVEGIDLPEDRTFVLNSGSPMGILTEYLFRRTGYAPSLTNKLRTLGPRIVHAHFGTCAPAAMALARALDVPFVVTFHGADATVNPESSLKTRRGQELRRAKDAVIREAGAFIAVSDHIRRRLMEQGYPEDKVVVLRNGIDVDFFEPTSSGERDPVILFVGRFVQKKGATYLLEAAQRLMSKGVRFELVMLGSGPLEDELREAATQSGLPCRFPGFMPLTGVMEWLQKARVVVVPSVTADNGDQEGLPTILLEAQAMETPIVATRHSGIPEGVEENVTAYLVDEKDTVGLADKLRIYLENPELARRAGVAGREFVLRNFDMRDQVRELENLYDRLQREYFQTGLPQGIRD